MVLRYLLRAHLLRRVPAVLAAAALAWLLAVAFLWLNQESLLFRPVVLPADTVLATEPDVHERWVDVPGARLSVLELRHARPRGVVFFLHGNNDNLRTWFTGLELYRRTGFDLVMPDYRGFGKSTGRIASQAELRADIDAVWRSVADRYRDVPVIAYGRSLGTALAADWAAREAPDLTILVSPYLSMTALAQEHYPWVPRRVLRYPLATDEAVARIDGPVLLVHGDRDELIPDRHARELARQARRAELLVVAGAGHGDIHRFPVYRDRMAEALEAVAADRARNPTRRDLRVGTDPALPSPHRSP